MVVTNRLLTASQDMNFQAVSGRCESTVDCQDMSFRADSGHCESTIDCLGMNIWSRQWSLRIDDY